MKFLSSLLLVSALLKGIEAAPASVQRQGRGRTPESQTDSPSRVSDALELVTPSGGRIVIKDTPFVILPDGTVEFDDQAPELKPDEVVDVKTEKGDRVFLKDAPCGVNQTNCKANWYKRLHKAYKLKLDKNNKLIVDKAPTTGRGTVSNYVLATESGDALIDKSTDMKILYEDGKFVPFEADPELSESRRSGRRGAEPVAAPVEGRDGERPRRRGEPETGDREDDSPRRRDRTRQREASPRREEEDTHARRDRTSDREMERDSRRGERRRGTTRRGERASEGPAGRDRESDPDVTTAQRGRYGATEERRNAGEDRERAREREQGEARTPRSRRDRDRDRESPRERDRESPRDRDRESSQGDHPVRRGSTETPRDRQSRRETDRESPRGDRTRESSRAESRQSGRTRDSEGRHGLSEEELKNLEDNYIMVDRRGRFILDAQVGPPITAPHTMPQSQYGAAPRRSLLGATARLDPMFPVQGSTYTPSFNQPQSTFNQPQSTLNQPQSTLNQPSMGQSGNLRGGDQIADKLTPQQRADAMKWPMERLMNEIEDYREESLALKEDARELRREFMSPIEEIGAIGEDIQLMENQIKQIDMKEKKLKTMLEARNRELEKIDLNMAPYREKVKLAREEYQEKLDKLEELEADREEPETRRPSERRGSERQREGRSTRGRPAERDLSPSQRSAYNRREREDDVAHREDPAYTRAQKEVELAEKKLLAAEKEMDKFDLQAESIEEKLDILEDRLERLMDLKDRLMEEIDLLKDDQKALRSDMQNQEGPSSRPSGTETRATRTKYDTMWKKAIAYEKLANELESIYDQRDGMGMDTRAGLGGRGGMSPSTQWQPTMTQQQPIVSQQQPIIAQQQPLATQPTFTSRPTFQGSTTYTPMMSQGVGF